MVEHAPATGKWQEASLYQLLSEASYGRVTSVAEAVTSPAIWSAFTGRIDHRILDILRNFGAGVDESSSLFSNLQSLNKTVVIDLDENSFKPFTSSITQLVRNDVWENEEDARTYQNQQARKVLNVFQSGKTDLMIYHVTTSTTLPTSPRVSGPITHGLEAAPSIS